MYSPTFKGPIEGYVANFAAKHQWRVSRLYQRDDIMQEAYIIFRRVADHYPDVEAPHFMALFKRTWHNHFTDLANEDTQSRILVQHTEFEADEGDALPVEASGDLDHDGYLSIMLRQAPREISTVLNLFLNAPQEMLDIALGSWSGSRDKRCKAGGSKRICQMLGIDPTRDIMKEVEAYFQHH